MRAKFTATNPNEINMTLTVSASMKFWKGVRDDLAETTAHHPLIGEINKMIHLSEKAFTATEGEQ